METVASIVRRGEKIRVLLKRLHQTPILSVANVEKAISLSRANASLLVSKFVESGILNPRDESFEYGRKFVHRECLGLFTGTA